MNQEISNYGMLKVEIALLLCKSKNLIKTKNFFNFFKEILLPNTLIQFVAYVLDLLLEKRFPLKKLQNICSRLVLMEKLIFGKFPKKNTHSKIRIWGL